MRLAAGLFGFAVVCLLAACSASVTTFAINDGAYKAAWSAGWQPVIQDAEGWAPSGNSPGVCNAGGSKQGCYDTDQRVAADLQRLLNDLATTTVPAEFTAANTTTEQAIRLEIQGLNDRNTAIAHNDATLFSRAINEIHQAGTSVTQAYNKFPNTDLPTPQPFGGPGHYAG